MVDQHRVGKQGRLVGAWSVRIRVWRADKAVSHDVLMNEVWDYNVGV